MVQKNELRIGNIVHDKNGTLVKVELITESGINLSLPDCLFEIDYAYLDPIPLTEEILLKCGFEKNDYGYISDEMELGFGKYLMGHPNNDKLYPSVESYEYGIGVEIEYLHHLQNLYFALNNKELEVKL